MWKWGPQQQRLEFSTVQIDTVGNRERVLYCRIIHLQLVVGKNLGDGYPGGGGPIDGPFIKILK